MFDPPFYYKILRFLFKEVPIVLIIDDSAERQNLTIENDHTLNDHVRSLPLSRPRFDVVRKFCGGLRLNRDEALQERDQHLIDYLTEESERLTRESERLLQVSANLQIESNRLQQESGRLQAQIYQLRLQIFDLRRQERQGQYDSVIQPSRSRRGRSLSRSRRACPSASRRPKSVPSRFLKNSKTGQ